MEQSTIHIKAPYEVHIAAKVNAAKLGKSMNQYIVDLIAKDTGEDGLRETRIGIEVYREKQPKTTEKVIDTARETQKRVNIGENITIPKISSQRATSKACKIHNTPMDARGRCLQKGCKYS